MMNVVKISLVGMSLMTLCAVHPAHAAKDLDIYLLIGQSNMAGRASIDAAIAQDTAPLYNTWLFRDSADWVPARNPLNLYSTYRKEVSMQRIGPGYGFALRMQTLPGAAQVGLVVQARGETSIDVWQRGSDLYENAVAKTRQAMQSGTLRAVLWHQGEGDNSTSATYLDRITRLITSLREDLGSADLPFIASQLLNVNDKYASFNSMITQLPAQVPHTRVVLTDATMKSFDGTHFDRAAQLELGTRFAGALLTISPAYANAATGLSIQAESATTLSDCRVSTEHRNYSGTGLLDFGAQGSFAQWDNITISQSATATISFRYANYSKENRSCALTVNGVSRGTVDFPPWGLEWDYWTKTRTVPVPLNAGTNTIRLTASSGAGGPNIDRLDIDGGSMTETLSAYASHQTGGKSVVVTTVTGQRLRATSYGPHMIRIQTVRNGEEFFADDRNAMVERHDHGTSLTVTMHDDRLELVPDNSAFIKAVLYKNPLRCTFTDGTGRVLLAEQSPVSWDGPEITTRFTPDNTEHFCGLGHGFFGRSESVDLRNTHQFRNYGLGSRNDQAPLVVPFYLSSRRYGVFLNTTFRNRFSFAIDNVYSIGVDDEGFGGRMDYFVIANTSLPAILNNYIDLTGKPRMPTRSMFGLRLSDKGSPNNNGEQWWKDKVTAHRTAGFPLDVVVYDNRWRAGSGALEGSWFEFDATRYPDPARFKRWCDSMGLTVSLDINRNNNALHPTWQASYNLPNTQGNIPWPTSAPDYSSEATGDWQWSVFWNAAFNPALGYPGDCIWIDETDDLGGLPSSTVIANGRTWAEMNNYYPFMIADAVGRRGWDRAIGEAKRPYIWTRAGTAGMQRHIVLWTGDTQNSFEEMRLQVRGMLASGLSGFPYFDHDAGGFWDNVTDDLFRQWVVGFGSLSPIWRPHGPGQSRWPTDRSAACQQDAQTYSRLRYSLMPYIYTTAHRSWKTGYPMAAPMLLVYPDEAVAWRADLQYLFGDNLLVAPNTTAGNNTVRVWLPGDCSWYDYWNDSLYQGGREIDYYASTGVMPLFARSGAIIPRAPYRLSTFFIPRDTLLVDVYTGKDGTYRLYDDDGVSEKYQSGSGMTTAMTYTENSHTLVIDPVSGTYAGAPSRRAWRVALHGMRGDVQLYLNRTLLPRYLSLETLAAAGSGQFWDSQRKVLHIHAPAQPVAEHLTISSLATANAPNAAGPVQMPRYNLLRMRHGGYRLAISVAPGERTGLRLINLRGAQVFEQQVRGPCSIDLGRELAAGIYQLQVTGNSGIVIHHLTVVR